MTSASIKKACSTDHRVTWHREPKAQLLIEELIGQIVLASPKIQAWKERLRVKTSCDLLHFLDHLTLNKLPVARLKEAGFVYDSLHDCWHHPGAQLPRVRKAESKEEKGIYIRVDQIETCLQTHRLSHNEVGGVEGSWGSGYRKARLIKDSFSLWIVERGGSAGFEAIEEPADRVAEVQLAMHAWRRRDRCHSNPLKAMKQAQALAYLIAQELGQDRAAALILSVEREYWQLRCIAGQIQKLRQDQLGLGWGNHDHHTFRASRRFFRATIELFETLGFHCRERFYAGAQAGWGAQVMENPRSGHTLFIDVDLSEEELAGDFAHKGLKVRDKLGTIGLWCALHGDSILKAGMHHLEGQFSFHALQKDLASWGVGFMKPFSEMSFLHQAFSSPQMWPVEEKTLEKLLRLGQITLEQKAKFAKEGAIGSHLENLERGEGYKGFNQRNVSTIIKETDPRKQ